jgi:hypothetical protein
VIDKKGLKDVLASIDSKQVEFHYFVPYCSQAEIAELVKQNDDLLQTLATVMFIVFFDVTTDDKRSRKAPNAIRAR